jgi:histidine triad (HIT) family protein
MEDCLFCKIIKKEIPSTIVYEDEKVLAFSDVNPVAPVHILVVPKTHIKSLQEAQDNDKELIGHIIITCSKIAKDKGLKNGYRVVNNCGEEGGQTVGHIHFHLLGGRNLTWPPG